MSAELPKLTRDEMAAALAAHSPEPLPPAVVGALHDHYRELRRWNRRLSLVGPGTAAEVVGRHYGEALAALPLLGRRGALVDIGSGAGFPGFVLAVARPGWSVTLVEARQRKWAFLEAARRRAALSCRCLNARVGDRLPPGFPGRVDVVTMRAVRLPAPALSAVAGRLSDTGRLVVWVGVEEPALPDGFEGEEEIPLAGSARRRIVAAGRVGGGS